MTAVAPNVPFLLVNVHAPEEPPRVNTSALEDKAVIELLVAVLSVTSAMISLEVIAPATCISSSSSSYHPITYLFPALSEASLVTFV